MCSEGGRCVGGWGGGRPCGLGGARLLCGGRVRKRSVGCMAGACVFLLFFSNCARYACIGHSTWLARAGGGLSKKGHCGQREEQTDQTGRVAAQPLFGPPTRTTLPTPTPPPPQHTLPAAVARAGQQPGGEGAARGAHALRRGVPPPPPPARREQLTRRAETRPTTRPPSQSSTQRSLAGWQGGRRGGGALGALPPAGSAPIPSLPAEGRGGGCPHPRAGHGGERGLGRRCGTPPLPGPPPGRGTIPEQRAATLHT